MINKLNQNGVPKWAALVNDRVIPLPRQILTARTIKEQAGVGRDFLLVRDYQSKTDVVLADDADLDLREGNVFRLTPRCDESTAAACDEPAKLAFFIDDAFEVTINPNQTEDSLRRLFGLNPKIQLLRDLESPNDTPIRGDEPVRFADGPVFVTCFDIESHCDGGEGPPRAGAYAIRIDDKRYVVRAKSLTGREILKLAGKNSTEWLLNQKIRKQFVPIAPDQVVDFTACGVERFTTLPNEQSEGRPQVRRQFALPESDTEVLDAAGLAWETVIDQGNHWVVIHRVPLPDAFVARETSVAIRIPALYPPAALDMAYFAPPVQRADGKLINRTEASVNIEGAAWQQWSRHYSSANPWKPNEYNVFTHFLLCQSWLQREANKGKSA
jgi:hypothetical protein